MTKYLLSRLIRGIISIIIVVTIVMLLVYVCLDRELIFAKDSVWSKQKGNAKVVYEMQKWEEYGYLDYVSYSDFLQDELRGGKITQEKYDAAIKLGKKANQDSPETKDMVAKFEQKYEKMGYTVKRLDYGPSEGTQRYFAYRDIPILTRLFSYLGGLFDVDNIHYAKGDIKDRGIDFTWFDPAYGGEKFSPAIIGNGTKHKYLLYFDSNPPFIHQNLISINLGKSYSINQGIDVFDTMTESQGNLSYSMVTYPTGVKESSADNIHSAVYIPGSYANAADDSLIKQHFTDDYTSITTNKDGMSKMGYSFVIGIISVIMAYMLAIPLGTAMARRKDKLVDKLGTLYIVFIIAVPSLAYIFLFKAIGGSFGLPTTFNVVKPSWQMYILPIVSLALPSVAGLMKWLRRYMIDQMNSDYVKFARSGGLSEGEIFRKHILKNAMIPIVHGIPGSVLGALVGAIITESVYVVPGAGKLLTNAISAYDNGVIVGMALFYATLSVVSIIIGDILMSLVDPRISFSSKAR